MYDGTDSTAPSTIRLNMDIRLNMYNVLDLATGDGAAIYTTDSDRPYLMFTLAFVNNNSDSSNSPTILELPFDFFVGLIQF